MKLACLVLLALAYLGLFYLLPPRHQIEDHWGDGGVNWFGQGGTIPWLYAIVVLGLLYLLRYFITTRSGSPAAALGWYGLVLGSLLPCVWLLVEFDWDNQSVAPPAHWVSGPVILFAVPTAFLCWDLVAGWRPGARVYTARSLLELALIPAWASVWVLCEFFLLGWFGF